METVRPKYQSVLFVDNDNINCSPLCEGIFRKIVGNILVDSAGIQSQNVGKPLDIQARVFARHNGYDISEHTSRVFTPQDFSTFDLIVALGPSIYKFLQEIEINNSKSVIVNFFPGNEIPEEKKFDFLKIAMPKFIKFYFPEYTIAAYNFEDDSFLYNDYNIDIFYDGLTYSNVDSAFLAQKALDKRARRQFQYAEPNRGIYFGRDFDLRPDWEEVKNQIMKDIVTTKFIQHPSLISRLLATGNQEIISISKNRSRRSRTGFDMLVKILLEVRQQLKSFQINHIISSSEIILYYLNRSILIFQDFQIGNNYPKDISLKNLTHFVKKVIKKRKPSYIIIRGEIFHNNNEDPNAEYNWSTFLTAFDKIGIECLNEIYILPDEHDNHWKNALTHYHGYNIFFNESPKIKVIPKPFTNLNWINTPGVLERASSGKHVFSYDLNCYQYGFIAFDCFNHHFYLEHNIYNFEPSKKK